MIYPKDLMIGDWAKMNSGPARITAIKEGEIHFVDRFGRGIASSCEEISLTPEILEKNGFELYGNEWQYHTEDDKGHVLIEFSKDNKVSINTYNSLALKDDKGRADLVHFGRDWCDSFYVHELQHAMRLCDIEKEILV